MVTETTTTDKSYLKTSEVARVFRVNHSTVFLWVKKRKLRPKKSSGGQFRFSRNDIEKLLKKANVRKYAEKRKEDRFQADFLVILKTVDVHRSYFSTAMVTDISRHGIGLVIENSNGMLQDLDNGDISEVTIFNYDNPLFKRKTCGSIQHFREQKNGEIALGVALI